MTTNITMRIDEDLKKQAEELFHDFGMSMSSAFIMFLRQSLREQKLPFVPSRNTPNAQTIAAIKEAREMVGNPNTRRFASVAELIEELNDDEVLDRENQ